MQLANNWTAGDIFGRVYAKYNETSSVDYLCKLSGAAAGLYL